MYDAGTFVRVCPQNTSLVSLICAQNENIQRRRVDVSLAQNKGLRELIRLRNEADDQLVQDKDQETACTLFDTPSKKPKVKRSRNGQKALRSNAETLTIKLEACGEEHTLEVLRPTQVNENLFIKYDSEMLRAMLHYIRAHGDEEKRQYTKSQTTKGIHKRKVGGFLVAYRKPDGSKAQKLVKTLDDAVAFQVDLGADGTVQRVDGDEGVEGLVEGENKDEELSQADFEAEDQCHATESGTDTT